MKQNIVKITADGDIRITTDNGSISIANNEHPIIETKVSGSFTIDQESVKNLLSGKVNILGSKYSACPGYYNVLSSNNLVKQLNKDLEQLHEEYNSVLLLLRECEGQRDANDYNLKCERKNARQLYDALSRIKKRNLWQRIMRYYEKIE